MPGTGDTTLSRIPEYLTLRSAFRQFALSTETQSQSHIKPLHQHISMRLVIEGGFMPDEVCPHPPLRCRVQAGRHVLSFVPEAMTDSEQTIIGGLKSKDVDVVVSKHGLGPVVAVSVKGTGKAFRNLTNRMEEAIGDCTNIHIMYPGCVYGFMCIIKGNRATVPGIEKNDVCIEATGTVVQSVMRYHDVLANLAGRRYVRDEYTRYEAVGFAIVESTADAVGDTCHAYPAADSPLLLSRFFPLLYEVYDLRYPYMAPSIKAAQRVEWDEASPAFADLAEAFGDVEAGLGYAPRMA